MTSSMTDLSESMTESLTNSDLQNVTVGLAESLSDSLLNDGLAKDIPILGTVIGLARFGASLRDRLFLKKLVFFLAQLSEVSSNERADTINKIEDSGKYRVRVGEKLLYIIDRCEDHEKARIVGLLFAAFIKGELSYDEFLRASNGVQSVVSHDLFTFADDQSSHWPISSVGAILTSGFCEVEDPNITVEDQWDWKAGGKYRVEGSEIIVYISDLGKKVRAILQTTNSVPYDDKHD